MSKEYMNNVNNFRFWDCEDDANDVNMTGYDAEIICGDDTVYHSPHIISAPSPTSNIGLI